MSQLPTDNAEYCSALVRAQDEDRWLACGYASASLKRALIALYAFQIELRRIPSLVSEPALGEIRLQWWREAFDEIRLAKPVRAHPVVEEFAVLEILSERSAPMIESVIDAGARPLYGETFADVDALESWLKSADGGFDALALLLAGGDNPQLDVAVRAGAGFALAREGRGLAPTLGDEAAVRARVIVGETAPGLKSIKAEAAPAVLHLSLTRLYARRAQRVFPVAKRLKLFSAMALGVF